MLGEIRGALSLGIPPRGYALRAIFVNRESELQKLAEDLRGAVERGRGKARLVIGDAGFGKSALIEFFKDYAFEHYDVAFSYVEARKLMSSRPSELFPALYRAVLENVEDKDKRRGRELLTEVSKTLLRKYSGLADRLYYQLRRRIRPSVREKFMKLGDETSSIALALLGIDELNPIVYDWIKGVRGLEPDEAELIRRVIGHRVPWRLPSEKLTDTLATAARALRDAGKGALVIALDEFEALRDIRKDLLSRFLVELTPLIEAAAEAPMYIIVTSTPGFWSEDEKSVGALYPFLFQRLDAEKIAVRELSESDAKVLAWKLIKLYEKAYGSTAVQGLSGDALGSHCFSTVQPRGHPRSLLRCLITLLDEKVVRA